MCIFLNTTKKQSIIKIEEKTSENKYPLKSSPIDINNTVKTNFNGKPIKFEYITVFFTSLNPIKI